MSCLWNSSVEPTDEYGFFLLNGSLTVILNIFVIFLAMTYADTTNKPHQIFVINMTASDVLTGLCVQLSRPFAPCFPIYVCGPYYIIAWASQMASVANLLWLNIDKLVYIRYPLHYGLMVTRRRVMLTTIVTWSALFIVNTISYFVLLVFTNPNDPMCTRVRFDPQLSYIIITGVAYVLPIVISFAISINIFIIAQTSSRHNGRHARKKLMRRIFFVFSSTLWTFVTCLPYRIGYIGYALCSAAAPPQAVAFGTGVDFCANQTVLEMITIFFKMMQIGTIGNPAITVVTQGMYRRRIVKVSNDLLSLLARSVNNRLPTILQYRERAPTEVNNGAQRWEHQKQQPTETSRLRSIDCQSKMEQIADDDDVSTQIL